MKDMTKALYCISCVKYLSHSEKKLRNLQPIKEDTILFTLADSQDAYGSRKLAAAGVLRLLVEIQEATSIVRKIPAKCERLAGKIIPIPIVHRCREATQNVETTIIDSSAGSSSGKGIAALFPAMARRRLLLLSTLVVFCKCFTSPSGQLWSARKQRTTTTHCSCSAQMNNGHDAPITSPLSQLHSRFQQYRSEPFHAPNIERVLLLSDLHCDYSENREWLSNLTTTSPDEDNNDSSSSSSSEQTMILIAGDVSHDLQILRWTFQTLKQKFAEVAFVPGNHELWLDDKAGERDKCADSIDKMERILQLCLEEDIRIGPVKVGSLWIVPLLSWHHLSFDSEPPICSESWAGIPTASRTVKVGADYRKTVWPHPMTPLDDSVAQFIDSLNDVILDLDNIDKWDEEEEDDATILTFSHFLPRVELLPEKRYLSLPTLPACSGSTFLESRLRELNENLPNKKNGDGMRHLHAFGHSHLAYDLVIEDVRYVHVPLAYPREWEQRRRSLEIGTMAGEESHRRYPVSIWEKQSQFPSEWLGGWWSKYYTIMQREPHRTKELAPWVARRFKRRTSTALVEDFDHVKMEMKHKLQHPSHWTAKGTWYAEKNTMKEKKKR